MTNKLQLRLNVFIENVTVQLVERLYMNSMKNLFGSMLVSSLSDDEVKALMLANLETAEERARLKKKLDSLHGDLKEVENVIAHLGITVVSLENDHLTNLHEAKFNRCLKLAMMLL
jgi:hypothetical protein